MRVEPKVLICPADTVRKPAASWPAVGNENLSYFVVLNADPTNSQMILAGDRNLTLNGKPVGSGVFTCTTNGTLGWTAKELHRGAGNILLCDGSVQQVTSDKLTQIIRNSGTNHQLSVP